jgi:hypothetical protein
MFSRRKASQKQDGEEERRHLEEIRWARKGVELAKQNRDLQVIAILMAIVGILVAAVLAWPSSPSPVPGKANITLVPLLKDAIISRPVEQLPSPPPYPGNEAADHCSRWWKGWFIKQQAIPSPANTLVQISAPANSDVTVTSASFRVFRSYKPLVISYIRCFDGGGPVPGTLLSASLSHPGESPTIVSDSGQAVPLSMPNAVINITAGHTEYVDISPTGDSLIYEWSVTLTTVVDQHSTTTVFGSARHPLRSWLGSTPSPAYDYFLPANSWRPVH